MSTFKRQEVAELREHGEGKLPMFSLLGGYPLYYVDEGNDTICARCANAQGDEVTIEAVEINYEETDLYCCYCDLRIPSAYREEEVLSDERTAYE